MKGVRDTEFTDLGVKCEGKGTLVSRISMNFIP